MAGYVLLDDEPPKKKGYVLLDEDPAPAPKSFIEEVKGGLASAPINLYLGAKQMFGGLSPVEQDVLRQNKDAERYAPVSSFISNVGTLAPAMMIPGANTIAGAAITGAATGAMQPVEGDQSIENIGKGKLLGSAIGAGGGAVGQYAGNKLGGYLQSRLADQTAEAASRQSLNSVRDATLQEAQAAGYKVPPSLYNPTFLGNRLESLGGKAAIKQQAAASNQETTNAIARKALGIDPDQPLTVGFLDKLKAEASAPYQEVASLPKVATDPLHQKWNDPRADLEALKQARNDAQGWFEAYNRSKSPEDLAKAKVEWSKAQDLETALEGYAKAANNPDLVQRLVEARKKIAQIYDVRRALNDATGDVSAQTFGRLFEKGKPLSDGLETIGKFRAAFPQVSQDGAKIPAAGVSKSEAIVAALLGGGGAAVTGNPAGLAAAALPMLSHPARSIALSQALQKTPEYSAGAATKAAAKLTPERAAMLFRALSQYGAPGLAAQ